LLQKFVEISLLLVAMKFELSEQELDFFKGMWLVDTDQVYEGTKKWKPQNGSKK